MHWIALLSSSDDQAAWGWWALQFTPRVAQVDEALLLEVSACERLWGGRRQLLRQVVRGSPLAPAALWAQGATGLSALAVLRLKARGDAPPQELPLGLPLDTLSSAVAHVPTLARAGCRTWGELKVLPRAGVARRFGAQLLTALDIALGEQPESYRWLSIPEVFDARHELPALATSAPELMWSAQRLLAQLQVWLQARQRGILALELEWTLDLRKLDGRLLPPHETLTVRTAQPTQDVVYLRRLVGEHLARATLAAPANHLRLRSLESTPWAGANTSLLPGEGDSVQGERLHQLVERLSVRLGADQVLMSQAQADHRPERMQRWRPAREVLPQASASGVVEGLVRAALGKGIKGEKRRGQQGSGEKGGGAKESGAKGKGEKGKSATGEKGIARTSRKPTAFALGESDALYPTWLLPEPLRLQVHHNVPHYGGPLRRLARMYRVETGWWEPGLSARRDYYIARSDEAGLVWIYREQRPGAAEGGAAFHWYLQGLYA